MFVIKIINPFKILFKAVRFVIGRRTAKQNSHFFFNFVTIALSEIIAEFPVGSSIINFISCSPSSTFLIFFNKFFADFLIESSSALSLWFSTIFLNLLRTPSMLLMYPIDAIAGSTLILKDGIFTVAFDPLTTLIFISFLSFTVNSYLIGSFGSTDSMSDL